MDAKTYPKPDGLQPRADKTCPLCLAPPNVAHSAECPWKLWADSPKVKK